MSLSQNQLEAFNAELDRRCAEARGVRTISVTWAPEAVQEAHDDLVAVRDRERAVPRPQSVMAALDALRSCGAVRIESGDSGGPAT